MTQRIENKVIGLIAVDRIDISLSSMHQKLARKRKSLAESVAESVVDSYSSERVFADVITEDNNKARGYKEGVKEFASQYPKYGKILSGMIEQKRSEKDTYLEFGINPGKKLASGDYITVMTGIGLTENQAIKMYPAISEVSRKLQNAKDERRSILLG
ncbi:MAG: hypothetical protein V1660_01110 [archaeon]